MYRKSFPYQNGTFFTIYFETLPKLIYHHTCGRQLETEINSDKNEYSIALSS